jgi:hypothetical protein
MKKERKKKKYYDGLRKDYEEARLPQIAQNRELEEELKHWGKAEDKRRKRAALERIEDQTVKLGSVFAEVAMKRTIAEEKAREDERQRKLEADSRRDRVAAGLHRKTTKRHASLDKSRGARDRSLSLNRAAGYNSQNSLSPDRLKK